MRKWVEQLTEAVITASLFLPVAYALAFTIYYIPGGLHQLPSDIGYSAVLFILYFLMGMMFWDKDRIRLVLPLALPIAVSHVFGIPFHFQEVIIIPAAYFGYIAGGHLKWTFILFGKGKQQEPRDTVILLCLLGLLNFILFKPLPMEQGGNSQNTAITIETAAMLQSAFSMFKLEHQLTKDTGPKDFVIYLKFVVPADIKSSYLYPDLPENPNWWQQFWGKFGHDGQLGIPLQTCSKRLPCLRLYNGGVLQYDIEQVFGGTSPANAVFLNFDPDGKGPQGRISFYQYFNGRLKTGGTKLADTIVYQERLTPESKDPAYLKARDFNSRFSDF